MSIFQLIGEYLLMFFQILWWFLTIPLDQYGNTPLTLIVIFLPIGLLFSLVISFSKSESTMTFNNAMRSRLAYKPKHGSYEPRHVYQPKHKKGGR